jgi:hypothetical protein
VPEIRQIGELALIDARTRVLLVLWRVNRSPVLCDRPRGRPRCKHDARSAVVDGAPSRCDAAQRMAAIRHAKRAMRRRHRKRSGMAFAHARAVSVRSHHEELAMAPALLPALSTLVPFAIALWFRIKSSHVGGKSPHKGDV